MPAREAIQAAEFLFAQALVGNEGQPAAVEPALRDQELRGLARAHVRRGQNGRRPLIGRKRCDVAPERPRLSLTEWRQWHVDIAPGDFDDVQPSLLRNVARHIAGAFSVTNQHSERGKGVTRPSFANVRNASARRETLGTRETALRTECRRPRAWGVSLCRSSTILYACGWSMDDVRVGAAGAGLPRESRRYFSSLGGVGTLGELVRRE